MYRPGLARPVSSSGTREGSPRTGAGSCSCSDSDGGGEGDGEGDGAETSIGSLGREFVEGKDDERTGSFERVGLAGVALTGGFVMDDDSRSRSRYISISAAVLLVVRFGGTMTC